MWVRFWGVRGSCPAPLDTDGLQTRLRAALHHLHQSSDPPDLTDQEAVRRWVAGLPPGIAQLVGGNTPCVEVRTAAGDLMMIDCGSGLRNLGNLLMEEEAFNQGRGQAIMLLTHFHWDHIQGLPFFKPIYIPGNRFDLYGRHDDLEQRLRQQQDEPFFPSSSWNDLRDQLFCRQLGPDPVTFFDGRVRLSSLPLDHPGACYAFRIEADGKSFVYATDGAYYKLDDVAMQPYVDFFRHADVLAFDAQFTLTESFEKRTWGHSSAVIGVELACQAEVQNLLLFHHDPGYDDATLEELLDRARQYSAFVPAVVRRKPDQVQIDLAREAIKVEL